MEIDHLGFIEENYYIADVPSKIGKEIYEIGYYFYMKVPEDFEPECNSVTDDGQTEYLEWVSPDEPITIFPDFFRTEVDITDRSVKHYVRDDPLCHEIHHVPSAAWYRAPTSSEMRLP